MATAREMLIQNRKDLENRKPLTYTRREFLAANPTASEIEEWDTQFNKGQEFTR